MLAATCPEGSLYAPRVCEARHTQGSQHVQLLPNLSRTCEFSGTGWRGRHLAAARRTCPQTKTPETRVPGVFIVDNLAVRAAIGSVAPPVADPRLSSGIALQACGQTNLRPSSSVVLLPRAGSTSDLRRLLSCFGAGNALSTYCAFIT